MFRMTLMSLVLYFANGVLSGLYVCQFLKIKLSKQLTLIIWTFTYLISQVVIFEMIENKFPINDVVKVLINIGMLAFLQWSLFYKNKSKQIFTIVSFMAGKEIVKYFASAISSILISIWGNIQINIVENGVLHTAGQVQITEAFFTVFIMILSSGVYFAVLYFYLQFICKKFIKMEYQLDKYENNYLILPSFVALCISITIRMMIISIENGMEVLIYDTVPATKFWIPFICILLLYLIIASVVLFQKMIQGKEEEQKRMILENSMEQMQREVREIQDIYADVRGLKHDMRSHLNHIALYIERGVGAEADEVSGYIKKMDETIGRLDFDYQTGNPITDIIIHQKGQESKKKQILFSSDFIFPSDNEIDVYDVGIILNNALMNAIEACEKVKGRKIISLHSYRKGNLFFIEINNSFDGEILVDNETGLCKTNKKDSQIHGLGMYNIKRCAEKYLGDISYEVSNLEGEKLFSLSVMMYGRISHLK